MQGVRAGEIDGVNFIGSGHLFQRKKQMRDAVILVKSLRLLQRARVNRRQRHGAGLLRGLDKLPGNPVSAYNSEANHKSVRLLILSEEMQSNMCGGSCNDNTAQAI